jgi:GT2 family glycosyltransferase
LTGADTRELVSAVIVNWNTRDLLNECLQSLHDPTGEPRVDQTVVYDNGSTDGSTAMMRARWPGVSVLAGDRNIGYARACNRALEASCGDIILFINADARLIPGALATMLGRLHSRSRIAVVGPRLVYADGSWQRWTGGRDPSLVSALSYLLFLERLTPSLAERSVYLALDTREAFMPDWLSSACMLVRRTALDEVGPFDERYFCYMDDVDICRRLRASGWEVWYEPAAVVVHLMGQSTIRRTGAASPAALRNFNDYFRRRNSAVSSAILRGAEVVGFGARAAVYGLAAMGSPANGRQAKAHLRNIRTSLQRGHV